MTYIIAGKLPESTFAMADCKAINGKPKFTEKVHQLKSSDKPTFCTLAGNPNLMYCLISLDEWYVIHDVKNDFTEGSRSIEDLKKAILFVTTNNESNTLLEKKWCRMIFISSEKVIYFDIKFQNNTISDFHKGELKENEFIDSHIEITAALGKLPDNLTMDGILPHCINHLEVISKYQFVNGSRYSFLLLENDKQPIFHRPYLVFSDILTELFNLPYEKLDSAENFDIDIVKRSI